MVKYIKLYSIFYTITFICIFLIYDNYNSFTFSNSINLFDKEFTKKYKNENSLFLILFTSNVYEELMNFYLSSIQKFNISNVIFLSLDYKGYYKTHYILPNVFKSNINHNVSEHIDYNTPLYWSIVYSKTDNVKLFLEKGYNVVLCDTDLHFFKDPRNYIMMYNTDLVTSCDHKCPTMNSGF